MSTAQGDIFGMIIMFYFLMKRLEEMMFFLATEPNQASMYRIDKDTGLLELPGFGKEIKYLESKGYVSDKDLMQMVPSQ